MTIDISKASQATKDRVCAAVHEWAGEYREQPGYADESKELARALAQLRAECSPKLRTRAEVDAEIANEVRLSVARGPDEDLFYGQDRQEEQRASRIRALCAEPVRDDDPAQDESLIDVLRQALDMAPDASEATVLARICKLRQEAPRPDRMTDAERALCDMCNTQEPWTPDDFALSEAGRRNFANKFNAVRDERRTKTKGATGAGTGEEASPSRSGPVAPTELERIRTALGEIRGVIQLYKKYAPLQVCVDIDEILKGVGA